jgi:hypothetical protein
MVMMYMKRNGSNSFIQHLSQSDEKNSMTRIVENFARLKIVQFWVGTWFGRLGFFA